MSLPLTLKFFQFVVRSFCIQPPASFIRQLGCAQFFIRPPGIIACRISITAVSIIGLVLFLFICDGGVANVAWKVAAGHASPDFPPCIRDTRSIFFVSFSFSLFFFYFLLIARTWRKCLFDRASVVWWLPSITRPPVCVRFSWFCSVSGLRLRIYTWQKIRVALDVTWCRGSLDWSRKSSERFGYSWVSRILTGDRYWKFNERVFWEHSQTRNSRKKDSFCPTHIRGFGKGLSLMELVVFDSSKFRLDNFVIDELIKTDRSCSKNFLILFVGKAHWLEQTFT